MTFDGFKPWGRFAERPFWQRDGPAKGSSVRCRMKICLVATDLPYLVEVLRGLADRPDCVGVKFSEGHRDGMHLGRVLLQEAEATARLVAELKKDPKLMTTLQDDGFFARFRGASSKGRTA